MPLERGEVLSNGQLCSGQPLAAFGGAFLSKLDAQRTNSLNSGHRACQGCGEALGARFVLDAAMRATAGDMIAVNATGCLEVFSARRTPRPPGAFRGCIRCSPTHPQCATGVAAALKAKGRTDIRVVAQAGDGGTVDIGFGCLSGMFERNDDVLFICYDNEAYMNTGVQRSSATPPASAHGYAPRPSAPSRETFSAKGKNVPRLADGARAFPYVATATVSELHDLEYKVQHGHDPCVALGISMSSSRAPWAGGAALADTILLARLAKETGLFPVFEAEHGEITAVSKIRRRVPIKKNLQLQGRYRHLFGSSPRPDVVERIHAIADRNIRRFDLLDDRPEPVSSAGTGERGS